MAEHAEPGTDVAGGDLKAADEAAEALVGVEDDTALEVAAGAEDFDEGSGDALDIGGAGELYFFGRAGGGGIANQLIEANGDGLSEVHRDVAFVGGDVEEPMAVAEVVVGKAEFFGAEEERDAAGGEALADEARAKFETADFVVKDAAADGGGADDEGTIGDGFGDGGEFFGGGEDGGGSNG